jgi:hypothetical protein
MESMLLSKRALAQDIEGHVKEATEVFRDDQLHSVGLRPGLQQKNSLDGWLALRNKNFHEKSAEREGWEIPIKDTFNSSPVLCKKTLP